MQQVPTRVQGYRAAYHHLTVGLCQQPLVWNLLVSHSELLHFTQLVGTATTFSTTVNKAEAETSVYVRELEIQQSILKAWGFHWQIHNEGSREPGHLNRAARDQPKLQKYLSGNRFKAEGVFSTISALADTLSSQEKLTKRYGIQLRPTETSQHKLQSTNGNCLAIPGTTIEDVKPVISEVEKRLSTLDKLKWALKDRDNFQQLITELKSHSESLYRLCPENAFESINVYLNHGMLGQGLESTSKLAIKQAVGNGTSSMRAGYELLASAATLKASINENRNKEQGIVKALAVVEDEQREMRYLRKGLALFCSNNKLSTWRCATTVDHR